MLPTSIASLTAAHWPKPAQCHSCDFTWLVASESPKEAMEMHSPRFPGCRKRCARRQPACGEEGERKGASAPLPSRVGWVGMATGAWHKAQGFSCSRYARDRCACRRGRARAAPSRPESARGREGRPPSPRRHSTPAEALRMRLPPSRRVSARSPFPARRRGCAVASGVSFFSFRPVRGERWRRARKAPGLPAAASAPRKAKARPPPRATPPSSKCRSTGWWAEGPGPPLAEGRAGPGGRGRVEPPAGLVPSVGPCRGRGDSVRPGAGVVVAPRGAGAVSSSSRASQPAARLSCGRPWGGERLPPVCKRRPGQGGS